MNDNLNELSQTLTTIAANAALSVGDILAASFWQGVEAQEKSGFFDLVTEYDRRAEAIISAYIFEQYPDSTIVGEEDGAMGTGAVRWYVDPIDGTTNFATGFPYFSVSIGAEYNGQILAGVVFDPLRLELFSASLTGAKLNGQPLRPRTAPTDQLAVLLTNFPYPGLTPSATDHLLFGQLTQRFRSVRRMGSTALELAYIACGRGDVALGQNISPWDVAGGYLLVKQTGGQYVPLNTAARPWLSPGFITCTPSFDLKNSVLTEFFIQRQ